MSSGKVTEVENCAMGTLRKGYEVEFSGADEDAWENGDRWEARVFKRGHYVNTFYGETLAEVRQDVQHHYGK